MAPLMGEIIDGTAAARALRASVKEEVAGFQREFGCVPGLATVLVGDNPGSAVYVRNKRKACAEAGIFSEGIELPGDFDEASGHRAGQELLAAGALPDAVFAANDMMALGCLYAFTQAGVRVPADVALAGFDDIPLARFVHPSLTTMQVSIAELGDRAMTRLMQLMDGTSTDGTGDKQTLVPRLIVRDSTTPPSGH